MPLSRKGILKVIILFLILAVSFQALISYSLSKSKSKLLNYFSDTLGYKFTLQSISFNFLSGLHIRGACVYDHNEIKPAAGAEDIFISIRLLPLFTKRGLVPLIRINKAYLFIAKETNGLGPQIIFSDICKKHPCSKFLLRAYSKTQ